MATAKTLDFSATQVRTAELAKALGHPARIAILSHLLRTKDCQCSELVDVLPLSQSTVSQHLKALKEVGLIQGTIDGPRVCYCVDPTAWTEAGGLLTDLLGQQPFGCGDELNCDCC